MNKHLSSVKPMTSSLDRGEWGKKNRCLQNIKLTINNLKFEMKKSFVLFMSLGGQIKNIVF